MAIIHSYFLDYFCSQLRMTNSIGPLHGDPIIELVEGYCIPGKKSDFLPHHSFSQDLIEKARAHYIGKGIVGVAHAYFGNQLLNQFVDNTVERKVIVLKKGYPALPATKAAIILKGFGYKLTTDEILKIYASYGLVRNLKDLASSYDFMDINRRIERLACLLEQPSVSKEVKKIQSRYQSIHSYMWAEKRKKEEAIKNNPLSRSLFFYYWKSFTMYGMLGLIEKGKQLFRNSKLGIEHEAKIVIDKIQNPSRGEKFYIERLRYKGINVDRSAIAKIFAKWEVSSFKSSFISNLIRLDSLPDKEVDEVEVVDMRKEIPRYVDMNFIKFLKGLQKEGVFIDAPGLLVLWVYIEELGIHHKLHEMGLANDNKGYCWFDYFLFTIARIFYGIPTYSQACLHEEPSLLFFSHLIQSPCNDSLLNGIGSITQEQVFQLQRWLLARLKELGIIRAERVAYDFHHIDLDVLFSKLRQFGKGPSPKKKVCYNGFRPHIAWDVDTGCLIIAEFRKASARGPSTFKRFVEDFMFPLFKGLFQEVYVDSEYTGKNVWNFVLDSDSGMNAQLTACIKQNAFVKRHRDNFLFEYKEDKSFWCYWDDDHVYSSRTFKLSWEYCLSNITEPKKLTLHCVVKKNIKTGKLRCFGSSKETISSKEILEDYSCRWIIENGIKDLIISYFLDKCPGTDPHHVNVHFLMVSICRYLYRMIQADVGSLMINNNGSVKSLHTMREYLFKQGCSKVNISKDTIHVYFQNSFSPKLTKQLNTFYNVIHKKIEGGLKILGGLKLEFHLRPPYGDEHKNAFKKLPFSVTRIFHPCN
jgi:hypothetical protein